MAATTTVANNGTQTLNILLGNGDGTFQNPITFAAGVGAGDMGIADFNNDGRLDFANRWQP
jgi:FG-GAP-like repeat